MITLDNKKLHDWILEKDILVNGGRKISRDIETIDIKVKRYEEREKIITGKVKIPQDLLDEANGIALKLSQLLGKDGSYIPSYDSEFGKVLKKIEDYKLEQVPKDIKEKHLALLKEKELCERERNKVALKVQKIKDRIIPLVQKEVKPLICQERMVTINIGRYDDIETAKVKDDKVIISSFNHLTEYMSKWK